MFNAPLSNRRAQNLIQSLDLQENSKILDIGCGNGALLRQTAAINKITGVGVDNNTSLIQDAIDLWKSQSTNSELTFICSDAALYLKDSENVDVIIGIGSEYVLGGVS